MPNLLLVMVGGAIGAGMRFGVGRWTLGAFGPGFPWGTLLVNLSGGMAAGLAVGLFARLGIASEGARLFLMVGLLGGFTTFSAFSHETALMIERGQILPASAYAAASVAGSVLLFFAGLLLARGAA